MKHALLIIMYHFAFDSIYLAEVIEDVLNIRQLYRAQAL